MKTFSDSKLPFGKYKGILLRFVNSNYLNWLLEQDWFLDKYDDLAVQVEAELAWRDKWNVHFYKDKIKA